MIFVAVLDRTALVRDGVPVTVPPGLVTELLVRLAVDAGRPVPADVLIEDLWGNPVSRNTLQAKVSGLRRVAGDVVESGAAGYTLRVDGTDLQEIEGRNPVRQTSLPGTGTGEPEQFAAPGGDPRRALDLLGTGPLLPGAGDRPWAEPHRARLAELRSGLTTAWLTGRLDRGDDITRDAREFAAAHPLHEPAWTLLARGLARSGRTADATAALRDYRDRLVGELGLDPGPDFRAVEERVLRQEEVPARGNLPALTATLIGRDADLAGLTAALGAHRLVTLTGPGGVGKTRIAIETARRAPGSDGSWLVRLESAHDQDGAWAAVAEAFDLGETTASAVRTRLADLSVLLVLDNCEHLPGVADVLAAGILDAAPGARVLATSQAPLGAPGEHVRTLAPLAPADAVTLFESRASVTGTGVPQLCRALDGLPLAIELAAARTAVLSVEEITRRLDDRFTLLTDATGRTPARRTLAGTIAWSYDLLFPDDQRGLQALSCFPGGTGLDALTAVLEALEEAVTEQAEAAAAAHRLGFAAAEVLHLGNLGRAQLAAGDPASARDTLQRAVEAGRATGDLRSAAMARVRLAQAFRDLGEPEASRREATVARDWFRSAGGGDGLMAAEELLS